MYAYITPVYMVFLHPRNILILILLENQILASCPWGPATAHGVGLLTEMYAIYMERYTSHRAIARCFGLGLFFQIWHFASHTGTLPILPNRSTGCPLSSYNIWQNAKYNWHAAKGTPSDPPCSQLTHT